MKTIKLRAGKERSLLRRHPWIFESAIERGGGDSGETVRVEGSDSQFLAWAAFSPNSKIRVRVWSFDETQSIDAAFFSATIAKTIQARTPDHPTTMTFPEGDYLKGLVVMRKL